MSEIVYKNYNNSVLKPFKTNQYPFQNLISGNKPFLIKNHFQNAQDLKNRLSGSKVMTDNARVV